MASNKQVDLFSLLSQLEIPLELIYSLRMVLGIFNGTTNRIINADESQFYVNPTAKRSWVKK